MWQISSSKFNKILVVIVILLAGAPARSAIVGMRLAILDGIGRETSLIAVGDSFSVVGYAKDLRGDSATGVFINFLNIITSLINIGMKIIVRQAKISQYIFFTIYLLR